MLDAEGSQQRYLPDNIVAAINWAINRAQQAYGWALANRKGPEEAMREMTKVGVWQTDELGTFLLDDPLLGYTVANVLAVYAQPYVPTTTTLLPLGAGVSQFRTLVPIADGKPCLRVTLEMLPIIRDNASMRGNEVLPASNPGRATFAYYHNNGRIGVIPRSITQSSFVAVAHLEKFAPMVDENSTTNMPEYTQYILADWAGQFLNFKQDPRGEGIGLQAERDAQTLFTFSS